DDFGPNALHAKNLDGDPHTDQRDGQRHRQGDDAEGGVIGGQHHGGSQGNQAEHAEDAPAGNKQLDHHQHDPDDKEQHRLQSGQSGEVKTEGRETKGQKSNGARNPEARGEQLQGDSAQSQQEQDGNHIGAGHPAGKLLGGRQLHFDHFRIPQPDRRQHLPFGGHDAVGHVPLNRLLGGQAEQLSLLFQPLDFHVAIHHGGGDIPVPPSLLGGGAHVGGPEGNRLRIGHFAGKRAGFSGAHGASRGHQDLI